MAMLFLEKAKNALRVKSAAFDEEIQGLISACVRDLQNVGVDLAARPMKKNPFVEPPEPGTLPGAGGDPLVERAVLLYCKANFGLAPADADRIWRAYEHLKCCLALSGDYAIQTENAGDGG